MSEVLINTCFDGSEISIIMVQQALSLSYDRKIAVQLKNINMSKTNAAILDFCKNDKKLQNLLHTNVIKEATNIYGIDPLLHIVSLNPYTYNILYLSHLFGKTLKYSYIYDIFSKFDEIWVADQDILDIIKNAGLDKNIFVVHPNIMVETDNINIYHKKNILCSFPKYAIYDWEVFFRAYLQTEKFSDYILTIISDIFVGPKTQYDFFVNIIKKIKKEYNVDHSKYKVELIFNQTPKHINDCIIKSDLLVLPFSNSNGWNLLAAQSAAMSKNIILTSKSSMSKHIYNCNIIADLPSDISKNVDQAIKIWKMFLNDFDINKQSFIVEKDNNFINFCNDRLRVVKR